MSIADKLQTILENEQKVYNAGYEKGKSEGGEKPTLFAPTIKLNSVSSELTITDNRNGDFVPWYNLYANGEFVTTLTSKTATIEDYIEHTETMDIKVQSNLTGFNPSESNVVEWKIFNVDGTVGLAYTVAGTYAICNGIGDAIATDIEIAAIYEGVPVTEITAGAFWDNTNITSVIIPDSVTLIDRLAFNSCTNLTSVEIGECVTEIGSNSFGYCDKLTSIIIPSSVTKIGEWAFTECISLVSVVIGGGVTRIVDSAFTRCKKLKRVDFSKHTKIPTLGGSVFYECPSTLQIKVPANLIDSWKNATNWSTYASKIVTEFTNEV